MSVSEKEQYKKKTGEKLRRLNEEIRELVAQADNFWEKTKEEVSEQAHVAARKIKEKREIAQKINDFNVADSEIWRASRRK